MGEQLGGRGVFGLDEQGLVGFSGPSLIYTA